jgi:DNA-binding NarL/FixJ family response regulator
MPFMWRRCLCTSAARQAFQSLLSVRPPILHPPRSFPSWHTRFAVLKSGAEGMRMSTSRSRILIADDHTLVAELCKKLLEAEFDVVGTACDGRALLRMAADLKPDVIVVDIAMPILNGLDAGQQIKQRLPAVKLVYLTMNPDPEVAAEAFRRGASGYLLKTCAADEMVIAVRRVLRGMSYMSPSLSKDAVNYLRRQSKMLVEEQERLTERQREVLQLLAEGKVMKEVGGILNMTTRTVAFHKYRIMEVIGARSNAELVRYAVRNHMIAA